MRIKDFETSVVSASCVNVMDVKDLNGVSLPVTDIKYSPNRSDAVNSNGLLSPPTTPSATTPVDNEYTPSSTNSGRFKFFKDGKFVLELWHHRNGERMYWIPVSKNSTYWPPTGNCASSRQESSTSLSVSDDNLSIQSSPWQRDHAWKQSIPRKNINRELEFYMYVLRHRRKHFTSFSIRKKRRRLYDPVKINITEKLSESRNSGLHKKNNTTCRRNSKIAELVHQLWERRSLCESISLCRTDPGIISPRKRILKEMEKVTLEEFGNVNKKYRAKTVISCSSPATVTSTTANIAKPVSSHSINSILARDEEPSVLRNLLRSPLSNENSHESSSRSTFGTDSPSSDIRVTTLNHPRCSTPVTSSVSPSFLSNSIPCPQPIPAYLPSSYLYHSAHPYLSPPSVSANHTPPYYPTHLSNYHNSPGVWGFRSISSLPRTSVYSLPSIPSYSSLNPVPWIPLAHSSFQSYSAVADIGTDVPLNLSKHPG